VILTVQAVYPPALQAKLADRTIRRCQVPLRTTPATRPLEAHRTDLELTAELSWPTYGKARPVNRFSDTKQRPVMTSQPGSLTRTGALRDISCTRVRTFTLWHGCEGSSRSSQQGHACAPRCASRSGQRHEHGWIDLKEAAGGA
jgi:hypothetical protein